MYIYFPSTLLDTDGYETVLNNLTELEGTLEMAVKACESMSNDSDIVPADGSTGGSTGGSDDGSTEDNFLTSNQSDDDNEFEICDKNGKKVSICHKGKTICISVNAIWQHLEQHEEDYKGTCDD